MNLKIIFRSNTCREKNASTSSISSLLEMEEEERRYPHSLVATKHKQTKDDFSSPCAIETSHKFFCFVFKRRLNARGKSTGQFNVSLSHASLSFLPPFFFVHLFPAVHSTRERNEETRRLFPATVAVWLRVSVIVRWIR